MINIRPISEAWTDLKGRALRPIFDVITQLVDQQVFDYDGSPEGKLDAAYKAQCWDYTNQKLYFKSTPRGDSFGWVMVN